MWGSCVFSLVWCEYTAAMTLPQGTRPFRRSVSASITARSMSAWREESWGMSCNVQWFLRHDAAKIWAVKICNDLQWQITTMTFLDLASTQRHCSIKKSKQRNLSFVHPSPATLDPSPWDVENPCLEINMMTQLIWSFVVDAQISG